MSRLVQWGYAAVALALMEVGAYLQTSINIERRGDLLGTIFLLFGLAAVLDLIIDRIAKK